MDICSFINQGSLKIIVRAKAPKTEIIGWDDEKKALKVNVHAEPEKGKANAEIIKFFSNLTKKHVEIISGKTSKQKLLRFG